MAQDKGASLRDRAVVNGAASVSALRASVPSAAMLLGGCSMGVFVWTPGDVFALALLALAVLVFAGLIVSVAVRSCWRRMKRRLAQAIEARSGETEGLDPQGESAVRNGCAPTPPANRGDAT